MLDGAAGDRSRNGGQGCEHRQDHAGTLHGAECRAGTGVGRAANLHRGARYLTGIPRVPDQRGRKSEVRFDPGTVPQL